MLTLIKVLVALLMLVIIGVFTLKFALIGFIAGVLMAWIVNNGIDRYERRKTQQN